MDFQYSLLQLVNNLWGLASRPLGYICNLKDNVNSLRNATDKLKAKSKDVLATVESEVEGGGVQCTTEVAYWLETAQKFLGQGDQILQEARERDQIKCLICCLPPNCWSSYKLGKRVYRMLNEVRELQAKEGKFNVVTSPLPPPPVLEMPMDETVGLDNSNLNEVWKWVVDEKQVGVIGLYGVGGVGKTTFMKRINEELFHANHGFEIVIWVVVSRQVNKDSIQDAIRKRLHIRDESWYQWSQEERVHHLCQALTQKKFVLLLDDLWKQLDLLEIGNPRSGLQDGSKVVFTTRQEQVCDQMVADKTFKVPCLKSKEALELFEKNIGESLVDCHQEIRDLANDIAKECKGLPIALITVGRAMAGKDNPCEWRHALSTLRNNPHKLSGMLEEVYHILELSYNSLNDSTLQACFLYCCLFPKDYPIITDEFIGLWIEEGLLGDTDDVYSMRDKGEYVLGYLKRTCLLESGRNDYGEQYVKMHGFIHDMAIWIARDHGQRENNLLVIENEEVMSAGLISKWEEAKKVSIWGNLIQDIRETLPACSQLETLFVRETNVTLLPRGFFKSACLTVLDMSDNQHIQLFPEEICNLICLRYLNLSATRICKLPWEIKNLTCLRWLLLDNTSEHFIIPTGAITSLSLNAFSQWMSYGKTFPHDIIGEHMNSKPGQLNEEEIIEELERMQHLTDLSIIVSKASSALKIFQSPNLQRSIRRLGITNRQEDLTRIVISYSSRGSGVFTHLEKLHLLDCPMLRDMEITQGIGQAPNCFPSLIEVRVENCALLDLSWLVHSPKLRKLTVRDCDSIEKIIGDGFAMEDLAASQLFSRLEYLYISTLPSLTSIYGQTLPFPQLEQLRIYWCPRLIKLPLDSNSDWASLEEFRVNRDWWDNLKWDDDAARDIFTAKVTCFY